ncbi:MAG: hypothetical protein D6743_05320 [Calditrichaeota bacterium]|nr:MAG: hypothetical protein D6743_05320 [Calditrichota bacterium]
MQQAAQGPIDFVRVAAGVVLFVIFAGKLLYDTTFFRNRHARDSDAGKDLLSMLGIVAGIALLVLVLVFFAALLVMNLLQNVRF